MRDVLLRLAAVLVVAALLLWPALYNGYVLLYPDSALYVGLSFVPHEYPPRSLAYPLLIYPLHFGVTLWTVIVAQALLCAWLLHETVAALIDRYHTAWLLVIGIVLATLSGLPWTVDQVMPDLFAGLIPLAMALLILRAERFSWPRRGILLAVIAIGIASHGSYLPLALIVLIGGASIAMWSKLGWRRALAPAAATVAGIALTVAINWVSAGQPYLSKGGTQFLFGRMVDDGLIAAYLDQVCPQSDLKLCQFKDTMPTTHNQYLWGDDEVFLELGGWDGSPELRAAIIDSIKRAPWPHLKAVMVDTFRQLTHVRSGDSLKPVSPGAAEIIETALPGDALALHEAMQQRQLYPFLRAINAIQVPAQLAALGLLFVLALVLGWRRRRVAAGFCLLISTALLANAFICGTFSGVADRYQSRVAWLAVLAVMAVAAQQWHGARVKPQPVAQQPSSP